MKKLLAVVTSVVVLACCFVPVLSLAVEKSVSATTNILDSVEIQAKLMEGVDERSPMAKDGFENINSQQFFPKE